MVDILTKLDRDHAQRQNRNANYGSKPSAASRRPHKILKSEFSKLLFLARELQTYPLRIGG